jgi:beta-lactamase regulating signal transducer with metallopeptidase domain
MIAAWMVYSITVATMLAMVAALLERVSRARGVPARAIWMGTMVATILLTASVVWRSDRIRPDTVVSAIAPGAAETSAGLMGQEISSGGVAVERPAAPASWITRQVQSFSSRRAWGWPLGLTGRAPTALGAIDYTLLATWIGLTTLALVLLAGSIARLQRRRSRWRAGIVDATPILITDGLGPVVVGILDSAIAVPAWFADLPAIERRLILEHERQHLTARDPLVMFGGLVLGALVPWNPAVWMMVRRLRRSMEIDCDGRVLRVVPARGEYAALLIDIGARSLPPGAISPALADFGSDLESRVDHVLAAGRRGATWAVVLQAIAGCALLIVACAAPHPNVQLGADPAALPAAVPAAPSAPTARDSAVRAVVVQDSVRRATAASRDAVRAVVVQDSVRRVTAASRDSAVRAAVVAVQSSIASAAGVTASTAGVGSASVTSSSAASSANPATSANAGSVTFTAPSSRAATLAAEAAAALAAARRVDSTRAAVGATGVGGGRGGRGALAVVSDSTRAAADGGRGRGGVGALAVMSDSARAAFLARLPAGTGRGGASGGAGSLTGRVSGSTVTGRGGATGVGAGGVAAGSRGGAAGTARAGASDLPAFIRGLAGAGGGSSRWTSQTGIASCAPFGCEGSSISWSSAGFMRHGNTNDTNIYLQYGSANPPRELTTDTLAMFLVKHYRRLFEDPPAQGLTMVVFALDTLGQVTQTKSVPASSISATRTEQILEEVFPGTTGQWLATGHVSGTIAPIGLAGRWLITVFGFRR